MSYKKTSSYLNIVPEQISFRNLKNGLEVLYKKDKGIITIKEQENVMVFVFPEELEWLIQVLKDIKDIEEFKLNSEPEVQVSDTTEAK